MVDAKNRSKSINKRNLFINLLVDFIGTDALSQPAPQASKRMRLQKPMEEGKQLAQMSRRRSHAALAKSEQQLTPSLCRITNQSISN